MTDHDEPQYRHHYRAEPEDVHLREDGDGETFSIEMPIASTGEVRNEGDDPLTREEIEGMATQLSERQIGVFPQHGRDDTLAGGRYSPFEKLGFWDDGDIRERDGEDADLLVARAVMPDPDSLPATTGRYREALSILKEQAARGISQDASIGWRDDDSFPGGVDLMEASIVGIGADPRTNTEVAQAMARAAVDAGADPEQFVSEVRAVVMGSEPNETDEHDMSEHDTESGESEDSPDDTQDEDTLSAEEFRQEMLDSQRKQLDILESLAEQAGDDKDDEDDDEDEQDADEPDAEQESDDSDEPERSLDELEAEIRDLRKQLNDAEPEDPGADGDERDSDESDDNETEAPSFSFAEAN